MSSLRGLIGEDLGVERGEGVARSPGAGELLVADAAHETPLHHRAGERKSRQIQLSGYAQH